MVSIDLGEGIAMGFVIKLKNLMGLELMRELGIIEKYYPEEGPGCSGWGLFLQIL